MTGKKLRNKDRGNGINSVKVTLNTKTKYVITRTRIQTYTYVYDNIYLKRQIDTL